MSHLRAVSRYVLIGWLIGPFWLNCHVSYRGTMEVIKKKRHVSVCEVLPRHQVSTIDRTLRGETGRKVWKRVLLPQLKSEMMRYERWSWFMEAKKKKWGWLSKLAFNSERGFYRPIVEVIGTESWQLRWSPYLGTFQIKSTTYWRIHASHWCIKLQIEAKNYPLTLVLKKTKKKNKTLY